jgi:hypothetical protein
MPTPPPRVHRPFPWEAYASEVQYFNLQLVLIGIGRLHAASAARNAPNSPCARLLPALSMVLL